MLTRKVSFYNMEGPTHNQLQNLLHRANEVLLENELSSRQLSVATLHVMLRCCWGIKEVLCVLDNKEDMLAQLSANALCRLFILLQDSKEELIGKHQDSFVGESPLMLLQ